MGSEFIRCVLWPVNKLFVDPKYQRDKIQNRVDVLTKIFDEKYMDPITISPRPNGMAAIVDGQHRYEAAVQAGAKEILCREVKFGSLQAEAKAFGDMNRMRKPPSGIELFRSSIVAKKKEAVALYTILSDLGLKIYGYDTQATAWNNIHCLGVVQRIHALRGDDNLRTVLGTLKSIYQGDTGAFASPMIRALDMLLSEYGEKIKQDVLRRALEGVSPVILIRRASSLSEVKGGGQAIYVRRQIIHAYNRLVTPHHRLRLGGYSRGECTMRLALGNENAPMTLSAAERKFAISRHSIREYMHKLGLKTQRRIGGCGWETLVLPTDVIKIKEHMAKKKGK